MQGFNKIAFLRANGLGDFIFAWPALCALKKSFHQAELVYIGKGWHKEFLTGRKGPIDRVIELPPMAGVGMEEDYLNNNQDIETFIEKMQKEDFDLVVQAHGGGRFSNPLVLAMKGKMNIGMRTEKAVKLDKNLPYKLYENEYLRYLELVGMVGAKIDNLMPEFEITNKDVSEAKMFLGEDNRKMAVLHPGASDPRRRWPEEYFAQIAFELKKKGFRIIVTGTGEENKLAKIIKDGENGVDKLSLNGLIGLLKQAELVISNDTGPLHLANALGTKTIGIFWVGNIINAAPPYKNNHVGLFSWRNNCPICGADGVQNKCEHKSSWVAEVKVEEVLNATEELVGRKATKKV